MRSTWDLDLDPAPGWVHSAGAASRSEFQLTLNALLATLQIEVGMASANGELRSLVRLDGEWQLTTSTAGDDVRIEPIYPEALPTVVASVRDSPTEPPVRVDAVHVDERLHTQ